MCEDGRRRGTARHYVAIFYKWELRKQAYGCWMVENMTVEPPPLDAVATVPLLASEGDGFI